MIFFSRYLTTISLFLRLFLLPLSPLLLPCASYTVWDTYLVHGVPVPYCPCWLVTCILIILDHAYALDKDCFKLMTITTSNNPVTVHTWPTYLWTCYVHSVTSTSLYLDSYLYSAQLSTATVILMNSNIIQQNYTDNLSYSGVHMYVLLIFCG